MQDAEHARPAVRLACAEDIEDVREELARAATQRRDYPRARAALGLLGGCDQLAEDACHGPVQRSLLAVCILDLGGDAQHEAAS